MKRAEATPTGNPASGAAAGWRRGLVYGLLLTTVIAWGGSFVAARMVLNAGPQGNATLSPTLLATVRFSIASAIFLPLLVRANPGLTRLRPSDFLPFAFLGQLGISVYFWLQYTGVHLTNAGLAALLVIGPTPLATMVVSGLVLGEPLGGRRGVALGLGALGVVVVVSQQELSFALESGFLFGALCLIANAISFAVYSTLVRSLRARHSPLVVTAGTTTFGALGLLLASAVTDDWRTLSALSPAQWLAVAYLAVVCSVLAYFFYNYALSRLEASKAAVWLYLEPPVAMLLGALLLGEAVTVHTVVGGLIILASVYLTGRS
jgi:drug/metabolite transporter (DMT)-like permease